MAWFSPTLVLKRYWKRLKANRASNSPSCWTLLSRLSHPNASQTLQWRWGKSLWFQQSSHEVAILRIFCQKHGSTNHVYSNMNGINYVLNETKWIKTWSKHDQNESCHLPSCHSQGAQGIAHDAATTEGSVEAQGVALVAGGLPRRANMNMKKYEEIWRNAYFKI